jgi:MoxR-like ATPase
MVDHLPDHRDGLSDRLAVRADQTAPDRQERTGQVSARRVMIIGSAGSGNSTAARLIGEKMGLPSSFLNCTAMTSCGAKRKKIAFFSQTKLPKERFTTSKVFNAFVAALLTDDTNNRTTP